jgi:hypothetical protein
MPYFLCRLSPPRKTFFADLTSEEEGLMRDHRTYWRAFADAETVVAMGPVADPAGGWIAAVLEAASPEAVKAMQAGDPLILADRGFHYETYPMPTILLRPAEQRAAVSSVTP